KGEGDGTLFLLTTYSMGISFAPSSSTVNNLNKDTYLNIVVMNFGSNDVIMFFGFNDGSFLKQQSYSLSYNTQPQSVTIGDVNNDSLVDIVVANSDADLLVFQLLTYKFIYLSFSR
ncbi:unnamed protein product, partial [Rotaria sp. Silwood2]